MKEKSSKLLLMLLVCGISLLSHGQEKHIVNGVVKDSAGTPLASSYIAVKGTNIGTVANALGRFKIELPSGKSVLVVSCVGYSSQEIKISGNNPINIILTISSSKLDEVVITGFGERRAKRNLGYSITQIGGDELRKTTVLNPVDALQGQVAGLQVITGTMGPGSTSKFLIRGSSSLNPYRNTPLIVMDGVILDQETSVLPNNSDGLDFGNILKNINLDDIESISVLKGGAVTALYGSKAANGVILIKTKKGTTGQRGLGVSVSHTEMIQHPYRLPMDLENRFGSGISADDFVKDANGQLAINPDSYGLNFGPEMTGQQVKDINNVVRPNHPFPYSPLNLYENGRDINTSISISARTENSSLRFSYSNNIFNSVAPNNLLSRHNLSLRATSNIAKVLEADANVSYAYSNYKNPGLDPLWHFVFDVPRNYDIDYWKTHYIDSTGGVNNVTGAEPFFFQLYQDNHVRKENNVLGSFELKANLRPWLYFLGGMYVNLWIREQDDKFRGQSAGFGNPAYNTFNQNLLSTRYRATFNLAKKIKEFDILLQIGGETNFSQEKGLYFNGKTGILPDVYRITNFTKDNSTFWESSPNKRQLSSLYFQGGVNWKDLLSLNVYGRNDWNSTLVYNDGHGRYAYFYYGADAALVFTDLFRKQLPKFMDYGKIRISYNTAGNGTDVYKTNTGAYALYTQYGAGSSLAQAYAYQDNTLPNQNLVPEKTSTIETGLEMEMFDRRLRMDITWYQKSTVNQIISFPSPIASGVGGTLLNGGKVSNKGLEVAVNIKPVKTKYFTWDSRFIYTLNRNKVISLPYGVLYQELDAGDGIRSVAKAGGDYGLVVAQYGYARYQAKDGSGNDASSPTNGMYVLGMRANNTQAYYLRAANVGTTPETKEPVIGSIQPKFLGSWQNTLYYKNFSVGFMLDARFGGMASSGDYYYAHQTGAVESSLFGRNKELGGLVFTTSPRGSAQAPNVNALTAGEGVKDNQQREDGIALEGVFNQGSKSIGMDGVIHDVSGMTFKEAMDKGYVTPVVAPEYYISKYNWSRGIREAGTFENSWVALRSVSLSYQLPKRVYEKLKLNGLSLSLQGRNLIYLYNSAPDHIFPELLSRTGSGSFGGNALPYTRSYGFSINASF